MKLFIKIPTRERDYGKWLPLYVDNITHPDTRILLSVDFDDPLPVPEWVEAHEKVRVVRGNSQNKIHAINRDINEYDFDWNVLLVGSDDMYPQIKGFDQIILDHMAQYYPNTDGCLWYHTEDHQTVLRQRYRKPIHYTSEDFKHKWICMLPVMGRAYYERFNYVYHPSYQSFWCDNEQTLEAVKLNKITYIHEQIIKHMHPDWVKFGLENDETYKRAGNKQLFLRERDHYNWRKARGFPKELTGIHQKG